MIKVVVIAILLLIAAYCSYQVTAIVNWQRLLRKKQEQFGVTYDNKANSSVAFMKQLRMVCVTCAALTIIVPAHVFPFSNALDNDINSYLMAESQKKSDQNMIRGISDEAVTTHEATPAEVTTTTLSKSGSTTAPTQITAFGQTTKVLTSFDNTKGETDLVSQWNALNQDVTSVKEIVIESYDTASEVLTEARVKSLLNKKLLIVDLVWDQEDYVIKLKLPNDTWIRLLLKNIKGNFYVRDEVNGQVYRLQ